MDCKRALDDAGGDFHKAIALIKERGFSKAAKRAGRDTGAGLLEAYVHNDRIGVLLELRSETDFVAHSDPFKTLAHELVMHIAAMDPKDVATLLEQTYVKDADMIVNDVITQVTAQVGENIQVGRFARYEI